MLGHLSFGVDDIDRAAAFYDRILAPLGFVRVWTNRKASALARKAAATSWLCSRGRRKRPLRDRAFI
jgi:catechol 2,3-dioxygenase-like lactoylglutathione lyase family enzyme